MTNARTVTTKGPCRPLTTYGFHIAGRLTSQFHPSVLEARLRRLIDTDDVLVDAIRLVPVVSVTVKEPFQALDVQLHGALPRPNEQVVSGGEPTEGGTCDCNGACGLPQERAGDAPV